MRHVLLAAAGAAVLALPGLALAQTNDTTGASTNASDMKGPPNANGYGKDTGLAKGSTVVGGEGSSGAGSPDKMQGSPNANGASGSSK